MTHFRPFLLLICIAIVLHPSATLGADCKVLPFESVETTLSNGLRLIVVPTGLPKVVSLQISVPAGPRIETESGKSGLAHVVEQLVARGTGAAERPKSYTADDFTNFETTFAKEDLEAVIAREADRVQSATWSEAEFQRQAQAIQEDYRKISASPAFRLFETQRAKAFTVHPYSHAMYGTRRDVEHLTAEFAASRALYERWYRPEYTTIVVAGDVDAARVRELVERYWGKWPKGSGTLDVPKEPPAKGPVTANVNWPSPVLPWVTVAFHSPAFSDTHKDYAALQAVLDVYFGPHSDLYKRLVDDEEKADQLGADAGLNSDPSLATIYSRVRNAKDLVYVRNLILNTAARARTETVSPQRLADVQSNARYTFERTLVNTEAIAATVARYARFNRQYDTLNRYFCTRASLTPEDLRAAAQRYMTDANLIVTTLFYQKRPRELEKFGSIETVKAADEEASVAGGEFPVIVQKTARPQVEIKLMFAAGSGRDPFGKEGLATLAASMIADGGTKELVASEIRDALFPIAGTISAHVDKETTTFALSVHRDNWGRLLDIALPKLFDPGLRKDDLRRLKDTQLNIFDRLVATEEQVLPELLQHRAFSLLPYGHPANGTPDGIDTISTVDLQRFIRRYYTTGNLTVGISGDAPDALVARVKSELARLPGGKSAPLNVEPRPPLGFMIEIYEKETPSTSISIGIPTEVSRAHPDFAALSVARVAFGDPMSPLSRLNQKLSVARGLNSSNSVSIESPGMRSQLFEIDLRPVAPDNAHMALRLAIYELGKMVAKGLTEDEFKRARDSLIREIDLASVDPSRLLDDTLDAKWLGIPDFWSQERRKLSELTLEEVNRVIRKYLQNQHMYVMITAPDARKLRADLLKKPLPIKYNGERPKALVAEDELVANLNLEIESEDIRMYLISDAFGD